MALTFAEVTATLLAAGRDPYLVYDHAEVSTRSYPSAEYPRPDRWSVVHVSEGVVVTYAGGNRVQSVDDLPDGVLFRTEADAYAWALEQAMTTADVGYRVLGRGDLDRRNRLLLDARSPDPGTFLGLPLVARGWRLARVGGVVEVHDVLIPGVTHNRVFADASQIEVEKVLIAALASSWWQHRPWRWPRVDFRPERATDDEWQALRDASLPAVITAVDSPDGAGILPTWTTPVPEDLVSDAVYAVAAHRRLYPDARGERVHLGSGADGPHYSVIRHPEPPRYELIRYPERSNTGTTLLRTDDPAELEAELLREL